MKRLGFEHLNGRIIYVKTTSEIDEIKRLKAENKRLKERLADEVLDHKIDEAGPVARAVAQTRQGHGD